MNDTKSQIAAWVREIHDLMKHMDNRWSMARAALEAEEVDEAIIILYEYFQMKDARQRLENDLANALRELGQESDAA